MLAVVKDRKGPGYSLKEVERPKIGSEDVLIRVKAVGICGTDVPILKGIREVPIPLIPGHEFAGLIEEVGSDVTNFAIGERVTPGLVIGCGECSYCRRGEENICDSIEETGIHVDGAFAEFVRVPAKVVHRIPEGVSFEEAASVDPLASAYHPVRLANVRSSDTAVVFGAGPIGLYATQVLKAEGARKVILVDIASGQDRLELGAQLGADVILVSDENIVQKILEANDNMPADIVVECTGNVYVLDTTIQVVRKNGTLLLVGIFHEDARADVAKIVRNELKIFGSICYTYLDYAECLALIQSGKIKTDPLISHRFPLNKIDDAFAAINNNETIKVMLYPDRSEL
ncbi:MAG: alcohol dehydrogenase catalytic domain-containing protein [Tissierellia bacterium]|nr:alcohol dehydrogenase catalytic domain-containing protein [Tissierellia bacterium]